MSQSVRERRRAPFELIAHPSSHSLWGHLTGPRVGVPVASIVGAVRCLDGTVTTWCSDDVEAARREATGQPPARRRGLARFRTPVPVVRRDLDDTDVVIATILALHPVRTSSWSPDALPADVVATLARTAITHRRPDGSRWRPASQRDADAVAALVCRMDDVHRRDGSERVAEHVRALAAALPDGAAAADAAMDDLDVLAG